MKTHFWILSVGLPTVVSAGAAAGMTIADAKQQADNQSAALSAEVVTYASTNFFYVEDDSRCIGIMVEMPAHGLTVGMRA